ncbi:hypothetical protein ILYODFUR_022460 [Ilyodon furcidens]|uniref:Uncharacterized protein n=1 Tax=Ilyodon furcidens TaxID=33524 RepID=A0ABV0UUK4_9TELE
MDLFKQQNVEDFYEIGEELGRSWYVSVKSKRSICSVLHKDVLEGELPPQSQVYTRFSSRIVLDLAQSVFPSTLTSFPVLAGAHPLFPDVCSFSFMAHGKQDFFRFFSTITFFLPTLP